MKKIIFCGLLFIIFSFGKTKEESFFEIKENLSEYGFFKRNIADQIPSDDLIPYQLNTSLFSDYAEKLRFIQLPKGSKINFQTNEVLDFPIGTAIIKTFYYPKDFRDFSKGRRIIETRLLLHEKEGWKALEYVWNEQQTDAYLEVAGENTQVEYIDNQGKNKTHLYSMPNLNQCKSCHNYNEKMYPIGPSVRQLNNDFQYANEKKNQIEHWRSLGYFKNISAIQSLPKMPIWNDATSGSLNDRARAWLDINCAHCHRKEGPAKTSGMFLGFDEQNPLHLGINKTPVAAGKGSGNRKYGIVKGQPDKSILVYRIESNDPGEMMPELGRKIVHKEGVELIKNWIKEMK